MAKFIVKNTEGATIGQTAEAPSADPYGTDSRYKPDQETQGKKYLPHTEYLALTQAKWEPVAKKLKSLNEKHLLAGNKHLAMNPDGVSRLESVLQATMGTTKRTAPPALLDAQRSIYTIITQWPYSDRLPALDVLRCLVSFPGSASLSDPKYGALASLALKGALDTRDPLPASTEPLSADALPTADASTLNTNNIMMALRVITNLFSTPEGRVQAKSLAGSIIPLLARIAGVDGAAPLGPAANSTATNTNLLIALTSAAFNYACLAYNEKESVALEHLMLITQVAEAVLRGPGGGEGEVVFRALMTVGMVLALGGEARDVARALEVEGLVREVRKRGGEERVGKVVGECEGYLRE